MKKHAKGFSLIAAIFVMVIFLLIGLTMVSLLSGDVKSAGWDINASKALYLAESGADFTSDLLLKDDINWGNNALNEVKRTLPVDFQPADPPVPWDSEYNYVSRKLSELEKFDVSVKNVVIEAENQYLDSWSYADLESVGEAGGARRKIKQKISKYHMGALKLGGQAQYWIRIITPVGGGEIFGAAPVRFICIDDPGKITLPSAGEAFDHVVTPINIDWAFFQYIALNYPAGHVIDSSTGYSFDGNFDGVYLCQGAGDVTIKSGTVINGSVIVEGGGSIILEPNVTISSQNNFPALATNFDIIFQNNAATGPINIKGLMFAMRHINLVSSGDPNDDDQYAWGSIPNTIPIHIEGEIIAHTGHISIKADDFKLYYYNTNLLTPGFSHSVNTAYKSNKIYRGKWEEEQY